MKNVLLAAPLSAAFRDALLQSGYTFITPEQSATDSSGIEGIVTSNKLRLRAEVLDRFPKLRWIARLGSGMEIIDTGWCAAHNIACFSSPAGIADSVGEHTLGLLLGLLHRIPNSMQEIQEGQWIREANRGHELGRLCVGLIGYGHTGQAVAKRLSAFTPHIVAYDKYRSGFGNETVREVSLQALQEEADVVSFHVPLQEDTQHYYNQSFLHGMKKAHYLLNVSRGAVCATPVILGGLESGKILGAGLDVLEEEADIEEILRQPENTVQRLLRHRVVLTPHIAGYSHEAIEKMSEELLNQLRPIL